MPIPFDRFTATAQNVLTQAYQKAQNNKHGYITNRLLFWALIDQSESVAVKALAAVNLNRVKIRAQIEQSEESIFIPTGASGVAPDVYKVFEQAVNQAERFGQVSINTGHLLLGLIDEGEDVVVSVITTAESGPKTVQLQLIQQLEALGQEPGEK